MTQKEIFSEALALPEKKRAELADMLLDSLEGKNKRGSGELHPDWDAELERRALDVIEGRVKGIPAEVVFKEMDKRRAARERRAKKR